MLYHKLHWGHRWNFYWRAAPWPPFELPLDVSQPQAEQFGCSGVETLQNNTVPVNMLEPRNKHYRSLSHRWFCGVLAVRLGCGSIYIITTHCGVINRDNVGSSETAPSVCLFGPRPSQLTRAMSPLVGCYCLNSFINQPETIGLTEVGVTRYGNWRCHSFFTSKGDDLFSHSLTTRTLSALPGYCLSSVLLNSAAKIIIFSNLSPPRWCHPDVPRPLPLVTPLHKTCSFCHPKRVKR